MNLDDLNRVLRYSSDTVENLLHQLASPEHNETRWATENADHTFRGVLADALDERDRPDEAALLRNPEQHILVDNGTIKPGAFKYRQAFYTDQAGELEQMIDDEGLEETMNYIRNNYDYGSGNLQDEPSAGTRESRHYSDGSGHGLDNGPHYMIGHHPGLGYVYTEEKMEVPADATHVLEGGKFLHKK
jgi:uncharacterized protein (TIGR02996 family)